VTDDPWGNPNVGRWLREGLRQYFTSLHKLMPGKLQLGNVTDWADDGAVVTEFQGVVNGGLLEGIMGVDWGVETSRGFNAMMAAYRKSMAAFGEPKLGIMHMAGDPYNFQELRYSLGATMLDDGYFAYSRRISIGDFETHDAFWFDEYDVNLGQATSSPPTTAWQKGVYRRDFENGIVLVNPKGNGQQEVTLEGEFRRIAGKQDPSVNNGQLSTKIVLKDRDGIVLLRPNPVKRPASPTNVRVD